MQTGIYLDYACDDMTAAALRLAGLFQRNAHQVNFLSSRMQQFVHSLWDRQVLSCRETDIARWTRSSNECVWFQYDAKRFREAMATRSGRKHILVPKWHDLCQSDFDWLGIHDTIVCSSPRMEACVQQAMRETSVRCPVKFTYWSAGLRQVTKHGYLHGHPRLMVAIDDFTMRKHGDSFIQALCGLLLRQPRLIVTVVAEGDWPARFHNVLFHLLCEFDERIAIKCHLPMDQRLVEIHQHDWLWVASVRGTTGFPVQDALACGVPVIAWDVEPFNELVLDGWNGHLIQTGCTESEIGAPTAAWESAPLALELYQAFRSEEKLIFLQEQDWLLKAQEDDFRGFWRQIIEKN